VPHLRQRPPQSLRKGFIKYREYTYAPLGKPSTASARERVNSRESSRREFKAKRTEGERSSAPTTLKSSNFAASKPSTASALSPLRGGSRGKIIRKINLHSRRINRYFPISDAVIFVGWRLFELRAREIETRSSRSESETSPCA